MARLCDPNMLQAKLMRRRTRVNARWRAFLALPFAGVDPGAYWRDFTEDSDCFAARARACQAAELGQAARPALNSDLSLRAEA